LIEELLPSPIVVEVVRGEDRSAYLLPDEVGYVQQAVDRRRREYTIGRTCARRALKRLGLNEVSILSGPRREPLWPAQVVGSITHCEGYCAVALARRRDVLALGIDAEVHCALPEGVLDQVSLPKERARIAGAPNGVHWDRLLFSAKEAVYKAYFPLTRSWLGFEQADLTFDSVRDTFEARLLVEPVILGGYPVATFPGRYGVRDELVFTAIALFS
jgi:4'-phosphopantetheinyl transferase EntD